MLIQNYNVIGVMSGTSLDGVDIAYISFKKNESWEYKILFAKTYRYDDFWREKLEFSQDLKNNELNILNNEYTEFLASRIKEFIQENSIKQIDLIGSHGHTIFHKPSLGYTFQIGNIQELANYIGRTVICDFRIDDVILGGQGAPLVPIGDLLLFKKHDVCLNLGGFANISIKSKNEIIAYDICAVNTVFNFLSNKLKLEFDNEGLNARKGKLIKDFYDKLEDLKYYKLFPPKSLGIEWVKLKVFPLLEHFSTYPIFDLLHTYLIHISKEIAKNLNQSNSVLITGGGAYNSFLIEQIRKHTKAELILPERLLIEYKEALIFGFLGVLRYRNEINCLKSVTGSKKDHSSGKIFYP
ncbi:MAG: anhydro-N-acetylmuramic acid kinase [Flavobacteriaceae bacterium]|nr:anhydro-N-acetylmuramic acid kinase [Flavobacteriaceae bacterium]|tara:strand:- start:3349 stop:4410 length:1062 start_codon:yes stop_codon:yes gene_type:complete